MTGASVSVIVPVHGGERFLAAALDSVAAQTTPVLETIVIDDGSPDGSAAIAAARPDVRLIRQARAGVAAARNAGLADARGDLVAFLDQDDTWRPDKVERQLSALGERPETHVVLSHMEVALLDGTPRPGWLPDAWLTTPQPAYVPSAWMVRRRAFDAVGLFDTDFEIACDSDWLARAKDAGLPSVMLPDVLLRWLIHGENGSYDRATMAREVLAVMRRSVRRQKAAPGAG